MHRGILFCLVVWLLAPGSAVAQSKRPLDHDAYGIWKTIEGQRLSGDGHWLLYSLALQDGDSEMLVHGLLSDTVLSMPRAKSAQFTYDSRYVVALVAPEQARVDEAKRQKKKGDDLPQDSLVTLDLSSGEVFKAASVKSFSLPEEAGGWLAYLLRSEAAGEQRPAEGPAGEAEGGQKKKDAGSPLVLRNLATGSERRFENVTEYQFAADAKHLAYAVSSEDGEDDGVFLVSLGGGEVEGIMVGEGHYQKLRFDESGDQLAFMSDREDYAADQPGFSLYHWQAGSDSASVVAREGADGVPTGWWVSEHGQLTFSADGHRIFFGTAPRPEPEVEDSTLEEDRVDVEIWNWKDPLLQPMQTLQLDDERRRTYRAVVDLGTGEIVQLATETVPDVELVQEGNAEFVLGSSELPYRQLISWDSPRYRDVYVVDVRTGERSLVLEKLQGSAAVSPDGHYVYWWDNVELAWFARNVANGRVVNMTARIPFPVHNEDHDWPYRPDAYGNAGWTTGDRDFLAYDRYDIWAADPDGRREPRSITEGTGRRDSLRFRYVRLEPDVHAVSRDAPLLLSAFNMADKSAGFYRDRVEGSSEPRQLVFTERRFSDPVKAKQAETLMFTRESVQEFPDLWVSGPDLNDMRRVSHANPQQSEYRWATVELVEWSSVDGVPLQGLLYKPEDFDPRKKYPMIVNFYEKDSQNRYAHYPPIPHRSVIRPTFYASRGYLVFIPDVVYQVGYPGESAMDCVVSGVLALIERGYVDPAAIGVQGHSWGGYQIAYMVTKTDLFAAAAAGAPVSDMISAYGGIRWGSGMSRMFQYEKTQSRIGATLWEAPLRYIENSPIFWADKVRTPLLMMHNDHDHAVPWYQGIEMFVALRRLGKPAWLVNYVGELHWPQEFHEKRDWNIRMQQFFDHYLRGAPAPVWLEEGIPALKKGRTLGLEPAQRDSVPGGTP